MERAQQVLTEAFGFDQFLPGQAEVIEHLLAGRSTLAIFPTGGGEIALLPIASPHFRRHNNRYFTTDCVDERSDRCSQKPWYSS